MLPFPHHFGSRDWVSDDVFDEPRFGEWDGPREYYNGVPPAQPLKIGYAGAPAVATELDRDSAPPAWPMENGFPLPCYAVRDQCEEELLLTDVTSADVWKRFATVICLLYTDGNAAVDYLRAMFPGIIAYRLFWDGGPLFPPSSIVARTRCTTFVVSAGTTTTDQLWSQSLYAATGPQNFGPFSTVATWMDAARYFSEKINEIGGASLPLVLAGHSYGGAACAVLAALSKYWAPSKVVRMITYGSPRPGDQRISDWLARVAQTNLQNEEDIVPQLPPNPFGAFGLVPILGTILARQWEFLASPQRNFLLRPDGTTEQRNSPTVDDLLIQNFARLIAGDEDLPAIPAHMITSYLDSLYSQAPPLGTCRADAMPAMRLVADDPCC